MSKQNDIEKAEAIEKLRGWLKPGDKVNCILRHTSRSGMSRNISFYAGDSILLDYNIAKALGYSLAKGDGVTVGGCGMDMGFSVVYNLSATLYGSREEGGGYKCLGKGKCPSNYHSNHHDKIRCTGDRRPDPKNPEGDYIGRHCWNPEGAIFSRDKAPEGWPRDRHGRAKYCITGEAGENPVVCKKCKGSGWIGNPEGPQRFDLMHTDGYAIGHRWL